MVNVLIWGRLADPRSGSMGNLYPYQDTIFSLHVYSFSQNSYSLRLFFNRQEAMFNTITTTNHYLKAPARGVREGERERKQERERRRKKDGRGEKERSDREI
jgi:hypothetical protein